MNAIIKKKDNVSSLPDIFYDDDTVITGKENIANGFNNFFANVGNNLAKNIPCPDSVNIYDFLPKKNDSCMFLNPVTEKEVLNTVSMCKSKTSLDCNDLNMQLLKDIFEHVIEPYTHVGLCNLSFENGVFPEKI